MAARERATGQLPGTVPRVSLNVSIRSRAWRDFVLVHGNTMEGGMLSFAHDRHPGRYHATGGPVDRYEGCEDAGG